MNSDADLEDWLRLALTPGLGAGGARRLLEIFGLPGNIFAAPAAALKQVLPPAVATALSLPMPAPLADTIKRTIDWAGQPGNRLMTLADADYPSSLLEIPDPPVLLY
ncbi:MAG: DNA-processing protein DprA, partial [Janthinobacterium lividum]